MKNNQSIDWVFLIAVFALIGLGIVLVYSSSSHMAIAKNEPQSFFVLRHLKKLLFGGVMMGVGLLFSPRLWKALARPLFFGSLILLILVFTPLGVSLNGARRWLELGFRFQPSEIAKIAFVIFLALKLGEDGEKNREFVKGFLPPAVITALFFALLIFQPNFSMGLTVGAIGVTMIFVAGCRPSHLLWVGLVSLPAVAAVAVTQQYRLGRILTFFKNPGSGGTDYQQYASLLSLGNGGMFGTGLGASTQKLGFLPMPSTDMIYAILGEELGFIGSLIVLILFALVMWRGMGIARKQEDPFNSLIATGLVLSIAVNVFIHIGVCTRLIPPTGQPLPLVSYGGSNLFATMFACGVLLRLSRSSLQPAVSE